MNLYLFKNNIKRHLSNLRGPMTDRKFIAFAVDDYGAIGTASKQVQEAMISDGFDVTGSRFSRFDALENNHDMEMLYDVLCSVKDSRGHAAVWTPLAVCANPDFDRIKASGFSDYYYEPLSSTLQKSNDYDRVHTMYKEGIAAGIFCPQFHGREHLNVRALLDALQTGVKEAIIPFSYNSFCPFQHRPDMPAANQAFQFSEITELEQLKYIIRDGLRLFETEFGYAAKLFNAPGERESVLLEPAMHESGIRFIETDKIKPEPIGGGDYKKTYRHNGQKNQAGQMYVIRNCVFEPGAPLATDWVEYTMMQIRTAFFWRKPAVISSHRVNFAGQICLENRKTGLNTLKRLFDRIVHEWPEVEFISSGDLYEQMYHNFRFNPR